MIVMLRQLFEIASLEYEIIEEIVETLDKLIIFGILDLNSSILGVTQTLISRLYQRIDSQDDANSLIIDSDGSLEEKELKIISMAEQISLKILSQSQLILLDDITIPTPNSMATSSLNVYKKNPTTSEIEVITRSFETFKLLFKCYLRLYSEDPEGPSSQELRYKLQNSFNTFIIRVSSKLPVSHSSVCKHYFSNTQQLMNMVWDSEYLDIFKQNVFQYVDMLMKMA